MFAGFLSAVSAVSAVGQVRQLPHEEVWPTSAAPGTGREARA